MLGDSWMAASLRSSRMTTIPLKRNLALPIRGHRPSGLDRLDPAPVFLSEAYDAAAFFRVLAPFLQAEEEGGELIAQEPKAAIV